MDLQIELSNRYAPRFFQRGALEISNHLISFLLHKNCKCCQFLSAVEIVTITSVFFSSLV